LSHHCFVFYFILTLFLIHFILEADTVEWGGGAEEADKPITWYFILESCDKHYQPLSNTKYTY